MKLLFFKNLWIWVFAGLFLGGIVHIVSILLMPHYAEQDTTTRFSATGRVNEAYVLPQVEAGKSPYTFADPNAAYAICPYDITLAPLRIRVESGVNYLLMVFLGTGGSSFYALSDKASSNGAMDIRLADADQMNEIELLDTEDDLVRELRVRAPQPKGIVLLRSVFSNALERGQAVERVKGFKCGLETIGG